MVGHSKRRLFYIGGVVYKRPDTTSPHVHVVAEDFKYAVERIVDGMNPAERYYEIVAESDERDEGSVLDIGKYVFRGFLLKLPESPAFPPAPVGQSEWEVTHQSEI